MECSVEEIIQMFDKIKNEQDRIGKTVEALKKMNLNEYDKLLEIEQTGNRRLMSMEVKIDSLEKIYNSLGKDLREQYFSLGSRIDILNLLLVKHEGEQKKNKEQLSAEEMLAAIKNMENVERWKLLDEMFYEYYNNRGIPRTELDLDC